MSTVRVDSSGVNRLVAMLGELENGIDDRLLPLCTEMATKMSRNAAQHVYGPDPFLEYVTGETGDSIYPYVEQTENGIDFGVYTDNLRTIYHEMGTGPIGTEAGYPGENDVDEPIVRRSTAWSYWSDSIPTAEGDTRSGFVTTEGVPPKAFMHQATEEMLILAEDEIHRVIGGIMNGK